MKNKKKLFESQPMSRYFTPTTKVSTNAGVHGKSKPKTTPPVATTSSSVVATFHPNDGATTVAVSNDLIAKLRAQKPEVKSRRVQIVLQPSFYGQVESVANQLDVSVNEIVRMALEHLINSLKQQ